MEREIATTFSIIYATFPPAWLAHKLCLNQIATFFFFFNKSCFTPRPPPQTHTEAFFFSFFHSDPVNTKQRRDGSLSTPDVILVKRDLMRKRSWPSLLPRLFHSLTARERANWEKTKRRPGLISTAVMDPLAVKAPYAMQASERFTALSHHYITQTPKEETYSSMNAKYFFWQQSRVEF